MCFHHNGRPNAISYVLSNQELLFHLQHFFVTSHISLPPVGKCATLVVILIVLVLYFLVPPKGDYTDVITQTLERINVNPEERRHKKRIKIKLFLYFPKVGRPL